MTILGLKTNIRVFCLKQTVRNFADSTMKISSGQLSANPGKLDLYKNNLNLYKLQQLMDNINSKLRILAPNNG